MRVFCCKNAFLQAKLERDSFASFSRFFAVFFGIYNDLIEKNSTNATALTQMLSFVIKIYVFACLYNHALLSLRDSSKVAAATLFKYISIDFFFQEKKSKVAHNLLPQNSYTYRSPRRR